MKVKSAIPKYIGRGRTEAVKVAEKVAASSKI